MKFLENKTLVIVVYFGDLGLTAIHVFLILSVEEILV